MLVIHPKDRSTSLAEAIYANIPNVHVVEAEWYERGIGQLLWQTPKEDPILIIGHGDCHGLYRESFNDVLEISPSDLDDPMLVHRLANCQIGVHSVLMACTRAWHQTSCKQGCWTTSLWKIYSMYLIFSVKTR